MAFLSEAAVELALLEQLRGLGYSIEQEENIGPDGHRPERESHDEVVLKKRFAINTLVLGVHWAGMPAQLAMDQMQLISEEVFPAVRSAG